ncbi:hypothetical protein [Pseudoruegeria sp. SK021]|uniref:hypothetical protein n=1 Tax=Pseudoruegeria sp. SK021 TaxID=1933035 RepID=UPI000A23173F|nr:hypothetical protein [Pseudoruegeria sp. SK021]OSP53821.1 hypothetical protein BV911_15760 [Pseudoruegeria sp. SK021]
MSGHEKNQAGRNNCTCAARLDRIEALILHLIGAAQPSPRHLVTAIADATDGQWFLAGEVWRMAKAEATAAAATGGTEPELAAALRAEGVTSAHGLGRFLAAREGETFQRGGTERGGTRWLAVSDSQTADPIQKRALSCHDESSKHWKNT